MVTCFIRYTIDQRRWAEFEHYARVWMTLIEKYGGTHHGYFVPDAESPSASISFPGIGEVGADNIAIALFTFPSIDSYESYRRDVPNDAECVEVTKHYERTKPFTKYERTFMRRVERD